MSAPARIYLSPPDVSQEDKALVLEALDSGWVAPAGPHLEAFEQEFAAMHGVRHAIALSSGTAALHLALLAAGVKAGDCVLCPTLTFAATANAICYCGAEPLFIDSESSSWNIDPSLVEEELSQSGRRVAAVVAVDLFGQPADYRRLREVCDFHGVRLIIDAAESLGAHYEGRPAGTQADIGCFSFNGNKIITTSGGGMAVTDNDEWAAKVRHLSTQAKDPAPHYEHSEIGFNYRMSNLLAALGKGQLSSLAEKVNRRRAIFARYMQHLSRMPGIEFMPELFASRATRWLTCLTIDPQESGVSASDVIAALTEQNIEARPVWKPMHLQPVHRHRPNRGGALAERLFRDGVCLPSGSSLSTQDQDRVIEVVQRTMQAGRNATAA